MYIYISLSQNYHSPLPVPLRTIYSFKEAYYHLLSFFPFTFPSVLYPHFYLFPVLVPFCLIQDKRFSTLAKYDPGYNNLKTVKRKSFYCTTSRHYCF